MKHKHADLIHAWADGVEIEYFHNGCKAWYKAPNPQWNEDTEFRVKPKEEFLKYRVALHKNPDGKFYTISYLSENYNKAERYSGFVTWLIDEQIVNIGWLQ